MRLGCFRVFSVFRGSILLPILYSVVKIPLRFLRSLAANSVVQFGCGFPLCSTTVQFARSLRGFFRRHSITFPEGARLLSTINHPLSTSVAALPRWVLRASQ